ncbi:hypothetical protein HPC49_14050 [Pyxidicoccus fallax]|uniref:Transposase n=1 Tax=Pyxidicoccus fallax TaxID=394095 RepID=A0A848LM58_9BACT|nr:hypothetical protein [Pyxidicoccus fallax]NMO18779.1 hypothetical protein [Pyxidicoccus fallax]NPC79357.1 hypothetical protein [Pyxidicoccus fallax]
MLHKTVPGTRRVTAGTDKGYDTKDFVAECRHLVVTPHVAQNLSARHRSAIAARTTGTEGYGLSQRARKRIEEIGGWMRTVGNFRKTRLRGRERTLMGTYFVGAAYNLMQMARLAAA